jgi:hypothetical protein
MWCDLSERPIRIGLPVQMLQLSLMMIMCVNLGLAAYFFSKYDHLNTVVFLFIWSNWTTVFVQTSYVYVAVPGVSTASLLWFSKPWPVVYFHTMCMWLLCARSLQNSWNSRLMEPFRLFLCFLVGWPWTSDTGGRLGPRLSCFCVFLKRAQSGSQLTVER